MTSELKALALNVELTEVEKRFREKREGGNGYGDKR
jgi:hypothetical protein